MRRPRTVVKAYEMQRRMISLYRSDGGGMAWRSVIWNFGVKVALSVPPLLLADRADLDISSSSSLVNGRVAADGQPPQQEIENEKCRRAITEERATRGRRRSSDGSWQLHILRCGGGGRALSGASVASTVVMTHLPVVVVRVLCEILGRSR
ncbi:hypothetical protein NL676_008465 [Syzygium grande]|nr:hypothetical protein NL676_008465 [Syzygium grande]